MTSEISKGHCTTCKKSIGQFKCEGCSQTFCIQHVVEHRQILNEQLEEIILEHDNLQRSINENENQWKSLMIRIEHWEQKSIDKIQKMAKETREKLIQYATKHKKQIVSQELQNFTQRLKKARENVDFFETDLQTWISTLEKLKRELKPIPFLNDIKEDKTTPLIYQIQIFSSPSKTILSEDSSTNQSNLYETLSDVMISTERFDRCYGNAKIEDNGRLVINGNDSFFGTEIRGKIEYSFGKHRLLLQINNNPSKIFIFIGIISKAACMGGNLFVSSSVYGWGDYNDYFLAGQRQKKSDDLYYIHTKEHDIIELILDCAQQTIYYTNERNQKNQKLNIDMNKCPFPWQLYISLGGSGDQIRLLNSVTTHF